MTYARKVDGNHAEIKQAFKDLGCSVLDMSRLGKGAPDLCVGYGGISMLVEVKDGSAKDKRQREARDNQKEFMKQWTGGCRLVLNLDDVAETVNVLRRWHVAIIGHGSDEAVRALKGYLG